MLPLQVIVPIHQGVHWALGVINLRDRQLEYFDSVCDGDSYPFSKKADPETVLEDLVSLIHVVVQSPAARLNVRTACRVRQEPPSSVLRDALHGCELSSEPQWGGHFCS
jgi:hypothetical protein